MLMVCCLVVMLMGCGYTLVRTGGPADNYGDNGKGHLEDEVTITPSKEEVIATTTVPLDVRQNLFGDNSQTPGSFENGVLTLEGKEEKTGVIYTLALPDRVDEVKSAKISCKVKGEGLFFVLNFKDSQGADQQKMMLYVAGTGLAERELTLTPIETYLQIDEKSQEIFELCVEVEKGKKLEINEIKVDFLSFEPETKTIVKHYGEQPPIPESHRYCHPGTVSVYNPYGYYDAYYDWWRGSRYLVWRNSYYSNVVYYWPYERVYYYHYYYPSSSINVYCEPSPRVRCAPQSRRGEYIARSPRSANNRASSSARAGSQNLAVNSRGTINTQKNSSTKRVEEARASFLKVARESSRTSSAQAPASQVSQQKTSWLSRLAIKGKERIVQGGKSSVPLKRNESATIQNPTPARRQGMTEAVQRAANEARETQPQRQQQVQPAPAPSSSANDDEEDKNKAISSSTRVRRSSR